MNKPFQRNNPLRIRTLRDDQNKNETPEQGKVNVTNSSTNTTSRAIYHRDRNTRSHGSTTTNMVVDTNKPHRHATHGRNPSMTTIRKSAKSMRGMSRGPRKMESPIQTQVHKKTERLLPLGPVPYVLSLWVV